MGEPMHSLENFSWACGHEGGGMCVVCATAAMKERDDCRAALAEAQGQVATLRAALARYVPTGNMRGPWVHGMACPAEDTDTDNVACSCGSWAQNDIDRTLLADTAAAAQAHDERIRAAERERCARVVLDEVDGADEERARDSALSRLADRIRATGAEGRTT